MDSKLKSALAVVILLGIAVCMAQIPVAIVGGSNTATGTWTLIQHPNNKTCATGTTCALAVSSTGTGHVIMAGALASNNASHISGVTGGGTYTVCAACTEGSATGGSTPSVAYALSSTSGTTTLNFTLDASTGSWTVWAREYSFTCSSASLDVGGFRKEASSTATPAGVTLSPAGASDVIMQQAISSATSVVSTISAAYSDLDANLENGSGVANLLNTTNGTAPTWTAGTATTWKLSALAIKQNCP